MESVEANIVLLITESLVDSNGEWQWKERYDVQKGEKIVFFSPFIGQIYLESFHFRDYPRDDERWSMDRNYRIRIDFQTFVINMQDAFFRWKT